MLNYSKAPFQVMVVTVLVRLYTLLLAVSAGLPSLPITLWPYFPILSNHIGQS